MKRKAPPEGTSDVPADDAVQGNGGHGSADDADKDVFFMEEENTQLQKGDADETQMEEDSEEEDDDEDEDDEDDGVFLPVPGPGQGPALGNGFYEVEAIRRRRVRKGRPQYFIKWRGWPETANTWEPIENLAGVPDVVEAFEASLRAGKARRRRRKQAVYHAQLKKRLERSATPYSLRRIPTNTVGNHSQTAPPLGNPSIPDIPAFPQTVLFADEVENNGEGSSLGRARHDNNYRCANASEEAIKKNEENDYDPKLSELKATTSNGYETDRIAIQFQEPKTFAGNHHVDGQPNGVCMEEDQSGRCRGAKRRKSGSVKRFKQDSNVAKKPDNTQGSNAAPIGSTAVPEQTGVTDNAGNNSQPMTEESTPTCHIVKILKPVGYSTSVARAMQNQDVSVSFMAERSDGIEVVVDNKYLKASNPLLLIDFYEQHIRYSPS